MSIDSDDRIDIVSDLSKLDIITRQKIENFLQSYKTILCRKPNFVICAPGRVNLIGDHIDYHGFSVLPMAIEKCILLGCHFDRESDLGLNLLRVNNANARFQRWEGQHTLVHGLDLHRDPQWYNYILCAYQGVLLNRAANVEPEQIFSYNKSIGGDPALFNEASQKLKDLYDFNIFVESDLPVASGLSSSSALICASSIATTLFLHKSAESSSTEYPLDSRTVLAKKCSYFEHLIGTQGGGMDQAVIMTAQEGYAKFVEFEPKLTCSNVLLPSDAVWLVSHCGSSYRKAATTGFNTRVLETKLGAAMIAKAYNLDSLALDRTITLAKIKEILFKNMSASSIVIQLQDKVFHNVDEYRLEEISSRLELPLSEIFKRFSVSEDLIKRNSEHCLKVARRCEHVFEEAERVEKFKKICETSNDLEALGELMLESHRSLKIKYECSHPHLDRLVDVAQQAGALGSRLTGAGWGGCIVTLVRTTQVEQVLIALRKFAKFAFRTEPRSGCTVIAIPAD